MKLKDSIILIVVVIIAIALGVFVGIKVTERKTDNKNNNQPTQSETDDKGNSDKDSLEEAEKIMSKYKLSGEYSGYRTGNYYIRSLNNENEMNLLAIQWANKSKVNCNDVKEYEFTYHTCTYETTKDDVYLYGYEDVLNKKKELFGSKATLEKKDILNAPGYNYEYISKINGYVTTSCMCGAPSVNYDSKILSAFKRDQDLIVKISVDDSDSNVSYYNYIFKLENDNYYLAEITEVK